MIKALSRSRRFRTQLNAALDLLALELNPTRASAPGSRAGKRDVSAARDAPGPHFVALGALAEAEGSKPIYLAQDEHGQRYVFKQCDPALAAAEETAFNLRRLGNRPVVPAWCRTLSINGKPQAGVVKRFIELQSSDQLGPRTAEWHPEQRAVMLLEHAWEWFLDNLDTNTSQYAVMGPRQLPVNIDWDRSFSTHGHSPMSRFAKYRATLPNARTFLYADYVEGKFSLPLGLLLEEARRIRRLPRKRVRRIIEHYAKACYPDEAEQLLFVATMLARQQSIEYETLRFIRLLLRERNELTTTPRNLGQRVRRVTAHIWFVWQVVLDRVLRGGVGRASRGVLTWFRARQS